VIRVPGGEWNLEARWGVDDDFYVDEEMEPDPRLNQMTNAIIGAAIEVHRALGPGHAESVYQKAMEIELEHRGIAFQRQVDIELTYRGQPVGLSRLDLLVEGTVIVDLKAVDQLAPVHSAQLISYLSITGHPLGLLINFNVAALRQGIKRIAGRRRN
jgi:GxxExxY protein